MRGQSLYEFVTTTKTEWQGAVVSVVAIFAILTLIALLTVYFAKRSAVWRQVVRGFSGSGGRSATQRLFAFFQDAFISAGASFCYVIIACIESWYAACYPPLGGNIPELCHRLEWAIAAVSPFFLEYTCFLCI